MADTRASFRNEIFIARYFFPTLQIFENVLQAGEEESAKNYIQGFRHSIIFKTVETYLSILGKDALSASLIPAYIWSEPEGGKPVALQVTGNGNCLYNSAPLVLCGNETRNRNLHNYSNA